VSTVLDNPPQNVPFGYSACLPPSLFNHCAFTFGYTQFLNFFISIFFICCYSTPGKCS